MRGGEYTDTRSAANAAMHGADPSLAGKEIHEVQPVKFGGDPTDPCGKVALVPRV